MGKNKYKKILNNRKRKMGRIKIMKLSNCLLQSLQSVNNRKDFFKKVQKIVKKINNKGHSSRLVNRLQTISNKG